MNNAIDRVYKEESSKKYAKYSSELEFMSKVFKEYCSNQLTKAELLEYFPVNDDLKDIIYKAIELRKPQVCQHLVNVHNSSNIPLVKSFDWDLKFVIGNSSLASFREQRATLILNCLKRNEAETLSVELNREMLDKLILELENQLNL